MSDKSKAKYMHLSYNKEDGYYIEGNRTIEHGLNYRNIFRQSDKKTYKTISRLSKHNFKAEFKTRSNQAFCIQLFMVYIDLLQKAIITGKTYRSGTPNPFTLGLAALEDEKLKEYRQNGAYGDVDLFMTDYTLLLPYYWYKFRGKEYRKPLTLSNKYYRELIANQNKHKLVTGFLDWDDEYFIKPLLERFPIEEKVIRYIIKKALRRISYLINVKRLDLILTIKDSMFAVTSPVKYYVTSWHKLYYKLLKKILLAEGKLERQYKAPYLFIGINKYYYNKYLEEMKIDNQVFDYKDEEGNKSLRLYTGLLPVVRPDYYTFVLHISEKEMLQNENVINDPKKMYMLLKGTVPYNKLSRINTDKVLVKSSENLTSIFFKNKERQKQLFKTHNENHGKRHTN